MIPNSKWYDDTNTNHLHITQRPASAQPIKRWLYEQPHWQEMKRWDGACVRKGSNIGSPPAEKRKATEGFLSFYWSLGTTLPGLFSKFSNSKAFSLIWSHLLVSVSHIKYVDWLTWLVNQVVNMVTDPHFEEGLKVKLNANESSKDQG